MNPFDNVNSSEIDKLFEETFELFELRKAEYLCSVISELESDSNPEHPPLKAIQYLIRELVRLVLDQTYGKVVFEKLTETASRIPEVDRNATMGKMLWEVLEEHGSQNTLSKESFSSGASVIPDCHQPVLNQKTFDKICFPGSSCSHDIFSCAEINGKHAGCKSFNEVK